MVKGTLGSHAKTVATLRQHVDAYKTLAAALEVLYLAGIEVNWDEYHRDFPAAHEVLELPMYAWDLENYWIQYRGDFCLTKGDGMIQQLAVGAPAVPAVVPKYISPCAQQIIEESHGTDRSSLVVESDIFDGRLLPVLQGHLVNGAALCPSVSPTQAD
jgi:acyl transferase domain-containing protein